MSFWQTVLISLTGVSWGGLHRNLWVQAAWHEPGVWAKVAVCPTPEEQGSSCLTPPSPPSVPGWQVMSSMRRHVWGWAALNVQVIQGVTLSEMTSVRLVPVESTTIQETMESLGLNFSLDPVVTKALLATKIQNLEEFRFLFEDESKVDTFLAKLQLGDERLIQGSRLRRAWTAVTLYYKNQDQDRSKVSVSDLDTMLADTELRDVKSNFWVRYRMRFPPEIHPADATLSRISRELSKRMLCVYNLWKVLTLQYQLHTTQKKRKLAEGSRTIGRTTWTASSPFSLPMPWREWPPGRVWRMPHWRSRLVQTRQPSWRCRWMWSCTISTHKTTIQHTASISEAGMAGSSGPWRPIWLGCKIPWILQVLGGGHQGDVCGARCPLGAARCAWSDQGRSEQANSIAVASDSDAIPVRLRQAGERKEGG